MRNRRTTPNWEEIANVLIDRLDELADNINWKLERGEDPAITVSDALEELEPLIDTLKHDPACLEGAN